MISLPGEYANPAFKFVGRAAAHARRGVTHVGRAFELVGFIFDAAVRVFAFAGCVGPFASPSAPWDRPAAAERRPPEIAGYLRFADSCPKNAPQAFCGSGMDWGRQTMPAALGTCVYLEITTIP